MKLLALIAAPVLAISLTQCVIDPATLAALEDADNDLPMALRHSLNHLLNQIALCETGMQDIERELQAFAKRDVYPLSTTQEKWAHL